MRTSIVSFVVLLIIAFPITIYSQQNFLFTIVSENVLTQDQSSHFITIRNRQTTTNCQPIHINPSSITGS